MILYHRDKVRLLPLYHTDKVRILPLYHTDKVRIQPLYHTDKVRILHVKDQSSVDYGNTKTLHTRKQTG